MRGSTQRELKMRGNIYCGSRLMALHLPMDPLFSNCREHSVGETKNIDPTVTWDSGLTSEAT
jgi:hypothetical protein